MLRARRICSSPDDSRTYRHPGRPTTRSSPNHRAALEKQTDAPNTDPGPVTKLFRSFDLVFCHKGDPSTSIRRPSDNVISTRRAETAASDCCASSTIGTATVPSISKVKNLCQSPVCRSRVPVQSSGPSTMCGSDWHSSNTDGQPEQRNHRAPSSARKSDASHLPTKTASFDPSCLPSTASRCPLSTMDIIRHT